MAKYTADQMAAAVAWQRDKVLRLATDVARDEVLLALKSGEKGRQSNRLHQLCTGCEATAASIIEEMNAARLAEEVAS